MNRLTFLKSLCALAIAPAALLRVLAREPVQVPERVTVTGPECPICNDPMWWTGDALHGTTWRKCMKCGHIDGLMDAKVPGGGE